MPLVSKKQKLPTLLKQLNIVAFSFVLLFATFLGINQAWRLQTPDVIKNQWIALVVTAIIFLIILLLTQTSLARNSNYYLLISGQIITYICFISYVIYAQRGMASSAIILYTIPIIVSAVTLASWAVITTAVISGVFYCLAAYKYFSDFPSEGYKAELYGQMFFYFMIMLVIARLIHVVLLEKSKK